jgi:LysR family nitrogen assimilation transcriptional regulator
VFSGSETSAPEEISFDEISAYPLILPSGQSGMRHRLTEEAHARGVTLNVVLEVQSETLVLQLVNQGFGATFLPLHAVRDGVEAGSLRTCKIINPTFPSHMYLAHAPKFPLNTGAQSVMALLREIAKERFP